MGYDDLDLDHVGHYGGMIDNMAFIPHDPEVPLSHGR